MHITVETAYSDQIDHYKQMITITDFFYHNVSRLFFKGEFAWTAEAIYQLTDEPG